MKFHAKNIMRDFVRNRHRSKLALFLILSLGLTACGEIEAPTASSLQKATLLPATGQVVNDAPKPVNIKAYAASRFLDQASFGPNAAAVAEVQSIGYASWIDRQLSLPPTQIDGSPLLAWTDNNRLTKEQGDLNHNFNNLEMSRAFVGASDQLRLRTTWALS
ncbi:MAG: DUF1800 family protein, partial [Betaproteobacteria bacterium]|nr:DUF1800 family protein [Betaproteobacteria bacterium]